MLSLLFLKRTNKQGWFRHMVTIFATSLAVMVLLSSLVIGQALSKGIYKNGLQFQLSKQRLSKQDYLKNHRPDATAYLEEGMDASNFGKNFISHLQLAKLTDKSPSYPGLNVYPEPNQLLISQSLADLIKEEPVLAERFRDFELKIIDTYGISQSPDELWAISQINPKSLEQGTYHWFDQDKIDEVNQNFGKDKGTLYTIVFTMMTLAGLGVSFPLFMLIIAGTRIGILQRQERYSALSLLGTSKSQINRITLAETLIGGVIGLTIGWLIYKILHDTILIKSRIAMFPRFYPADLELSSSTVGIVFGTILVVIIIVNFLAIRKAKTSPLGTIKRQQLPKKPGWWRLLPALIPIAYFGFINYKGGHKWLMEQGFEVNNHFINGAMIAFVITMISLLLISSFLTYLISLLMAKFANKPTTLMASKRLKIFAKPLSHSVNGIVLALFVGSFFVTSLAITQNTVEHKFSSTIMFNNASYQLSSTNMIKANVTTHFPDQNTVPYLEKFQNLIKQDQQLSKKIDSIYRQKSYYDKKRGQVFVYSCADLKTKTMLKCPAGSSDNQLLEVMQEIKKDNSDNPKVSYLVKPIKVMPTQAGLDNYTLQILVKDEKDIAEVEEGLFNISFWMSIQEPISFSFQTNQSMAQFNIMMDNFGNFVELIYIGTAATILIGGFSLAIATIGGFFERKKSFANLRLIGIDMTTLNKTVLIESFVPMLLPAIFATGAGIGFANAMLKIMEQDAVFSLPSLTYFLIVLASFVASLLIIYAILPILKQITELDKNRTE